MTYNPGFKVTIIQRQITRKWYNIELYLRRPTNRKLYMIYRRVPCSMTLNDPYPGFQVTPFFNAEYLRNGTRYRQFQWNTNRLTHALQWHEASRGLSATAELLVQNKAFLCFSKASKIPNLLSPHGFFQAQNAPKSVFSCPLPKTPPLLSALWASIFGPSGLSTSCLRHSNRPPHRCLAAGLQ